MKTRLKMFPPAVKFLAAGFMLMVLATCNDKNFVHPNPLTLLWDFNSGTEGWSGDFAEYPAGEEDYYELLFMHDTLPEPLDQNQGALMLSGSNHNGDLFMFVKRKVTGLDPNTAYYITFTVEFASNEPETPDASGGGGNLIHVAAGASTVEPSKILGENNIYKMNIEKCNEGEDGENMMVIGNFINETKQPVYALKTIENAQPFYCTTNEQGEVWVIIGTDSALDTTTTIYYNSITVDLY